MTEWAKFQSSTMFENYIRLLNYITSQMDTDEIDAAERRADTMKSYINYYLEHLDEHYMWELRSLISLDTIKEKILDVPFGFGNKDCDHDKCYFGRAECDKDKELYLDIKHVLYNEMYYRMNICKCANIDRTEIDQCWECMVRDCGCKASPSCCGWHPYADRD